MSDERPRLTDPRAIRALAHPARLAILEYLGTADSATATECADVVGMSPSATSYHLRELARYGLVSEATGTDRRERRWRSSGSFSIGEDPGDPELRDAELMLGRLVLGLSDERARAFLERSDAEPKQWWNASTFNESRVFLTVDEARALVDAFTELLKPYARKHREAPPDARLVQVTYRVFPLPE